MSAEISDQRVASLDRVEGEARFWPGRHFTQLDKAMAGAACVETVHRDAITAGWIHHATISQAKVCDPALLTFACDLKTETGEAALCATLQALVQHWRDDGDAADPDQDESSR